MASEQLKLLLNGLDLTQADFARLIGVTSRAVNLWMTEERAVPGPAAAYARLLSSLPLNLRQLEFSRLKQGGTNMRDGMFGITYQGQAGAGMAVLIFEAGRIYGTDALKGRYDGAYVFNENSGLVDATVKVTFPPNVPSVFGIVNPYEWSIDVTASFNPKQDAGQLNVRTSLQQPLHAQFAFLRPLPEAA
jgi:transcriptional regulator with XRE-family HTH domain